MTQTQVEEVEFTACADITRLGWLSGKSLSKQIKLGVDP
jgi:hypothetical protein